MQTIAIPNVTMPFQEYFWINLRFSLKKQPLLWVVIFPLLTGLLVIYQLVTGKLSFSQLWAGGAGAFHVFMAGYVIALPFLLWNGMKKRYATAPFLHTGVSYSLNTTGLTVDHALTQAALHWPAVQEVWHIDTWLLLLTSNSVGHFVDLRCIQQPADGTTVLELLHDCGVVVK